jgi:small subunit ribosomal protein S20
MERFRVKSFFACNRIETKVWRKKLANIKSAIKRNKQNEKRRVNNRVNRGRARTFIAKAQETIEKGDTQLSAAAVLQAVSELDKAAQKGVLHANNAARRKSRLMKRLAAMTK